MIGIMLWGKELSYANLKEGIMKKRGVILKTALFVLVMEFILLFSRPATAMQISCDVSPSGKWLVCCYWGGTTDYFMYCRHWAM